jgi:hypothetical protein
MLTHTVFGRREFLAYGQEFHGPLIALGVSLLLALLGRWRKAGFLATASGGAGVMAGWYALSSLPLVFAPRLMSDRLPLLAAGSLTIALGAARLAPNRGSWPPLLLTALACGWWLAGAPESHARILAVWPIGLGVAVAVIAVGWLSAGLASDALRPALAAFTLAASLHVVGASWPWTMMALVPACASLAMVVAPGLPSLALLPLAADTAAVGCAADLSVGRLARGEFRALDIAVLSPLLALLLAPKLTDRLRAAGRLGPLVAMLIAGSIAVGVSWGALRLRGR